MSLFPESRSSQIKSALENLWFTLFLASFVLTTLMAGYKGKPSIADSVFCKICVLFFIGSIVVFFGLCVLDPLITLFRLLFYKGSKTSSSAQNILKNEVPSPPIVSNEKVMSEGTTVAIESAVNKIFTEKAKDFLTKDEFMKDYLWKLITLLIALIAILKFIK